MSRLRQSRNKVAISQRATRGIGIHNKNFWEAIEQKARNRGLPAQKYDKDPDYRTELESYIGRRVLIRADRWEIIDRTGESLRLCAYGPVLTKFCGQHSKDADIHIGHLNVLVDRHVFEEYEIHKTDTLLLKGILHEYPNHRKKTRNIGLWCVTLSVFMP